mgnify:FL=1
MARELYNWDQLRGYSIIALCNLLDKNNEISLENFIKELDSLQTLYGKEGVIGLSRRYLNIKNKI